MVIKVVAKLAAMVVMVVAMQESQRKRDKEINVRS